MADGRDKNLEDWKDTLAGAPSYRYMENHKRIMSINTSREFARNQEPKTVFHLVYHI